MLPCGPRRSWLPDAALAGLLLAGQTLLAQVPPKLDALGVTWFQRGTTNEVTLTGDGLAGVNELRITGAGITGSVVVPLSTNLVLEAAAGGLTAAAPQNAKSASGRIVLSPDAAPGPRELRVLGPNGVSNPLSIQVSDIPEVLERTPNQGTNDAHTLRLPVGVSGVIAKATESDWYRFEARAGQRLILDVQANRNGSPLDPTLVVRDAAGKELARSEDSNGLDPFLEFAAPTDGVYFAEIHDLRFQGAADYRYRLVIGELPYLDQLFPFGGRRGSSVDLTLRGRNLDGSERMTLRVAPDAPLGRQDVRARTPRGFSNPLTFEASDLPDFTEAEPNNDRDKANAVAMPVAINGRIGEKGDIDTFRLKASADQRLVIEVKARTFGSPLDALLVLSDAAGNLIQQNDDSSGPDARLEFDAKKDTEYLLAVRDLTDRGGERFGYRLTVQPPNTAQDFVVRANVGRVRVGRGGTTAVRCDVERRNGFSGVVRIEGRDLPAGVSVRPLVVPPEGPQYGWLELAAAPNAMPGTLAPFQVVGTAEIAGGIAVRPVQFPEGSYVTVLPAAPFALDAITPAVQLDQNTGTELNVSVLRQPGFTGEVKVFAEDLPGITFGGLTLPAGQSRGKLAVNAAFNCETGTRMIQLRGEATVDGQPAVVHATAPIPVTVNSIPFFITAMLPGSPFFRTDPVKLSAVALPSNTTSAANSSEFVVKVERRNFTNEIQLALEGLPAGVVATSTNLTANAKEVPIRLLVTDKTATGTNFNFTVVASAPFGDRTFRQKSVPLSLAVAAPEKETASTSPTPVAPAGATAPSGAK